MRGQKIGKRASNAGVDFSETKQIIDLMRKQLDNLELAISTKNGSAIDDVFGDVLLSGCNLSRFIKKDSEKALTFATNKFIIRFRGLEQYLKENGKTLEDLTDEEKFRFLCGEDIC